MPVHLTDNLYLLGLMVLKAYQLRIGAAFKPKKVLQVEIPVREVECHSAEE
jgi:hypothetical protein